LAHPSGSVRCADRPGAREIEAAEKLRAYARLCADVFRDDRMCLCGMLAADYTTLPESMRERVVRFFDDNEVWLTHVLEGGLAVER